MGVYVGDKGYAPYVGSTRRKVMIEKALPYDAEIEYLESTGTQWIDTGIVCRSYDGISAKFQANGQQLGNNAYFFFGQGINVVNSNIELYTAIPKEKISFCIRGNTDATLDYTNVFNVDVENKIATYTDELGQVLAVADRSTSANYTAAYTMAVFATHRASILRKGNVRCFKFQIIQDSAVVIDLIPVRVGQTGYMYDKVSGELFGNSGTGDFILGPDREVIMTSETNPEVLAVCYAQGWCASSEFMTKREAEAVTDIGTVFRSSNIKSFDELIYFTGLRTIRDSAFRNMSQFSGRIYIPEGVTQVEGAIVAYTGGVSALILPSTLLSIKSSFRNNSGTNVVFQNETIPVISDGATRLGTIQSLSQLYYVPDNSRADYQPIMPSNLPANNMKNLSEFDW